MIGGAGGAPARDVAGPFTYRRSADDGDGYEIADPSGVVAIWVRGEALAARVVRLLNMAGERERQRGHGVRQDVPRRSDGDPNAFWQD